MVSGFSKKDLETRTFMERVAVRKWRSRATARPSDGPFFVMELVHGISNPTVEGIRANREWVFRPFEFREQIQRTDLKPA